MDGGPSTIPDRPDNRSDEAEHAAPTPASPNPAASQCDARYGDQGTSWDGRDDGRTNADQTWPDAPQRYCFLCVIFSDYCDRVSFNVNIN